MKIHTLYNFIVEKGFLENLFSCCFVEVRSLETQGKQPVQDHLVLNWLEKPAYRVCLPSCDTQVYQSSTDNMIENVFFFKAFISVSYFLALDPDPPSDLLILGQEEHTIYLSWKLPQGGFERFQVKLVSCNLDVYWGLYFAPFCPSFYIS